ncbi:MAG: HEAT repeat domain-containing protein [Geobacteraceae bacterium]|jgi:HEAT repeat protein|nr:HEAT repeat domain-containing protein [Geobacteraceae bacterium]
MFIDCEELKRDLFGQDDEKRERAAYRLRYCRGDEGSFKALQRVSYSSDEKDLKLVGICVETLGLLNRERIAGTYYRSCFNPESGVRRVAYRNLRLLGDTSAFGMIARNGLQDLMEKGLSESDPEVKREAIIMVGALGRPEMIDHLNRFISPYEIVEIMQAARTAVSNIRRRAELQQKKALGDGHSGRQVVKRIATQWFAEDKDRSPESYTPKLY